MSFFSEEAALFAREYAVVEAMRAAWAADIQRFFEELYPAVEKLLQEKQPPLPISWKRTSACLYWGIPSPVSQVGNATLWYAKEYPELIRDRQVHWSAYLDMKGAHAPEAVQAEWARAAEQELQKLKPKVTAQKGSPSTFAPLKLILPWTEDPITETASPLADSLEVLHRVISKVGKLG